MATSMITQEAVEVLSKGSTTNAMVTQEAAEVLSRGSITQGRVTQVAIEILQSMAQAQVISGVKLYYATDTKKTYWNVDGVWTLSSERVFFHAMDFYLSGVLAIQANARSSIAHVALKASLVRLAVDTAPTGADLIVDIHKNGVTIFTTQANRPKIIAGASSGISVAPDVTEIAVGDKITLEIDQVGSTIAGGNLAVSFVYTQTQD